MTESILSDQLGMVMPYPVRLFDLSSLSISLEQLQGHIGSSFRDLPWDEYDTRRERIAFLEQHFPGRAQQLEDAFPAYYAGERDLSDLGLPMEALDDADRAAFDRIRPYRRRAVATFVLTKDRRMPQRWHIDREVDVPFGQRPDHERDYRQIPRHLSPSPPAVTEAPEYRMLLRRIALITDAISDGSLTAVKITCHQMALHARAERGVTNAPEGVHQDGADYIVSALVIDRRNVAGGESVVYGADKRTEYFRHTLLAGQGLFQADSGSPLWHWASPIHPVDPTQDAYRNILGYDITVL